MADIDKALPNVETEIKLPSEEEIAVAQQENIEEQVGPDDIEVTQEEDGGATISFDPEAVNADRKSTRLNSSHGYISYAVFCLKKKRTI